MPLFKYAKKLNNFYKMSFLIFWKSFPTWKKLFWKSFPTGRGYFSKSFLTYYFNLEEVIFPSLFKLGRSYFSKSFLFYYFYLEEVIFPSLFQLGRSYFSKSFSIYYFYLEDVIFGSLFQFGRSYFSKFSIGEVFKLTQFQSWERQCYLQAPLKCSDHSFQHTLTLQLWCACYLTRILITHP